jgi:hypothetical protein
MARTLRADFGLVRRSLRAISGYMLHKRDDTIPGLVSETDEFEVLSYKGIVYKNIYRYILRTLRANFGLVRRSLRAIGGYMLHEPDDAVLGLVSETDEVEVSSYEDIVNRNIYIFLEPFGPTLALFEGRL